MVKTLLKSVREYKKATMLTPVFITLEVVMECLIPYVMALMIDTIDSAQADRPICSGRSSCTAEFSS